MGLRNWELGIGNWELGIVMDIVVAIGIADKNVIKCKTALYNGFLYNCF
jgi:hypothetical protein